MGGGKRERGSPGKLLTAADLLKSAKPSSDAIPLIAAGSPGRANGAIHEIQAKRPRAIKRSIAVPGQALAARPAEPRFTEGGEPRIVGPGFYAQVYEVVRRVPRGKVTTYGDVGTVLGSPRGARQVGYALAALNEPDVPWHRVINAQGAISFRGDEVRATLQRKLLLAEGVRFDAAGRLDLARFRYDHARPRPRRAR